MIYSYLDEELGVDRAAEVREHLEACPGCERLAAVERRFLARIGEAGRETAPASLRSRIEGILSAEADGTSGEEPRETAVTPIGSPRWRRALAPVAAAAMLALLLLRPWGDTPSTARAASFAADYAAHAVSAPSSHPFAEGAEVPEPPPVPGGRFVGLSECVLEGAAYAHYTYAIGDRHLSVFLPLGDAPLPGPGIDREGPVAILSIEETGAAPGAVLVSDGLDADELRSIWPGA